VRRGESGCDGAGELAGDLMAQKSHLVRRWLKGLIPRGSYFDDFQSMCSRGSDVTAFFSSMTMISASGL